MCVAWGTICLWCCGSISTLPSWWWMCLSPSLQMGTSTITMALAEYTRKGKRRQPPRHCAGHWKSAHSAGTLVLLSLFIALDFQESMVISFSTKIQCSNNDDCIFLFVFDLYSSPTDLSSFDLSMDDISGICADHQDAAHSAGTQVLLSSVIVLDI